MSLTTCNCDNDEIRNRNNGSKHVKGYSLLYSCMLFKIQFNRGTSSMQHYVGLRPMFDLEVMNADTHLVIGEPGSLPSPSNVTSGLTTLYKQITGLNDSHVYERCGFQKFLLI